MLEETRAELRLAEVARAKRKGFDGLFGSAESGVDSPDRKQSSSSRPFRYDDSDDDGTLIHFQRTDSKEYKFKAPAAANWVTYKEENKAQRDLIDALRKAGYLQWNSDDDLSKIDKEKRLGEYWFDHLYTGFYMRRSENAIPDAKKSSLPPHANRFDPSHPCQYEIPYLCPQFC
eukprot:g14331.t1